MEKPVRKRKIPSIIRWILWVLLVQFVLINISAAFYAYRLTHFYTDPALRDNHKPAGNIFSKTWKLFSGPHQARPIVTEYPAFPFDTVVLHTKSGLTIDTWYSKSDSVSKGTVLMFHGITANKGMMLAEASEFRYLGFNVILVDLRGHGNSAGNTTTMGMRESEEVKLAYDYVSGKGEKNIYCWGVSMGAVVIAKAISDYDLSFKGLILEMPFASMQSYLKARARNLGFPEQPFGFLATLWISIERGVNGFKHQTTNYVKDIHCPVLMQWGALDEIVLKNETDKIFAALPSANKKLVIYEQCGHSSLLQEEPAKWRTEVSAFMQKNSQ